MEKINFNTLEFKKVLDFLNLIKEEDRLKILILLNKKSYCVCELVEILNLPQNLISYHLKNLKNFNLLILKPKGRKNFYVLNQKQLKKYLKSVNQIFN
jgi:ArsR family transcriptional regulator